VCLCAGCISLFKEKPTGDELDKMKNVSKNATEQDPFEASMGIYVFKRDVLVSLSLLLSTCNQLRLLQSSKLVLELLLPMFVC